MFSIHCMTSMKVNDLLGYCCIMEIILERKNTQITEPWRICNKTSMVWHKKGLTNNNTNNDMD